MDMRGLLQGRRKLITIPLLVLIGLAFLPIALGIGAGWLVYKKIGNSKLKYSLLVAVAFLTLFFGGAWISAMTSPSKPGQKQITETASTPTPQIVTDINKESSPTQQSAQPTTTPNNRQMAKVIKVVDGDTIDVSIDGKTERIRIIGINTPETVDPRKPVECFGQEASAKAKEYLTDKTVQLESDPTQGERDKYNRLLRYVWIDNGTVDFGKLMIATGYAYEYTYNLPYKYQAEYKQAQKEADQGNKGLWADNACPTVTTKPTTIPTQSSGATTPSGGACKYSCTSPDRDCSDFSTHAEAVAFFNCCGFTATNDPMKLDSVGVSETAIPANLYHEETYHSHSYRHNLLDSGC